MGFTQVELSSNPWRCTERSQVQLDLIKVRDGLRWSRWFYDVNMFLIFDN